MRVHYRSIEGSIIILCILQFLVHAVCTVVKDHIIVGTKLGLSIGISSAVYDIFDLPFRLLVRMIPLDFVLFKCCPY